jgi:hypothetical protein
MPGYVRELALRARRMRRAVRGRAMRGCIFSLSLPLLITNLIKGFFLLAVW